MASGHWLHNFSRQIVLQNFTLGHQTRGAEQKCSSFRLKIKFSMSSTNMKTSARLGKSADNEDLTSATSCEQYRRIKKAQAVLRPRWMESTEACHLKPLRAQTIVRTLLFAAQLKCKQWSSTQSRYVNTVPTLDPTQVSFALAANLLKTPSNHIFKKNQQYWLQV